ncbi:MBL fold metallo-hydrolase [Clostridium sp. BJN0001]|uniref:MBL fold metallo-hydrolase n=1 Tax=Clostridium sp. BJN0001 TaxID=2930219 RepID=UPI001FD414D3|nr:MBL fold metallo-hydrolase [Clostridium sp. BJN0001]
MNFKLIKKLLIFLIIFLLNLSIFPIRSYSAEKTSASITIQNEEKSLETNKDKTSKDGKNSDKNIETDYEKDTENENEENKEEFIEHGFKDIDGKTYYIVNNEILKKTGWFYEKDENKDLDAESDEYNYKYYLNDDHSLVKGWKDIDGNWYFFNANGVLQTGWFANNRWYYADKYGVMQTGWKDIDGYTYHFDKYGQMAVQKNLIDGIWYFFNDKGQLQNGFYEYNGKTYYSDDNNEMLFDKWIEKTNGQYYIKSDGSIATGLLYLDDLLYTFNDDGILQNISSTIDKDILTVTSLNVGTADCHYIKLPDGKVALIDTGDVSTVDKLLSFLKSQNLKKKDGKPFIDYIVLTHPHSDHIGGISALIDNFTIGKLFIPDSFYDMKDWTIGVAETESNKEELSLLKTDYKVYKDAIDKIKKNDIDVLNTESGSYVDDEKILQFVNSNNDFTNEGTLDRISEKYWALNDNSDIVYLKYGDLDELFTGDIQWNAEKDFFDNKRLGDSCSIDVLKAPHHGIDTSSSYEFVSYLNPSIVVVPRKDDIPKHSNPDDVYNTLGVRRYYTYSNPNGITINATKDNWTVYLKN